VKETFLPIGRLREEFNKLYEYLEALDSPIVFSHNDLLLGNVISPANGALKGVEGVAAKK